MMKNVHQLVHECELDQTDSKSQQAHVHKRSGKIESQVNPRLKRDLQLHMAVSNNVE